MRGGGRNLRRSNYVPSRGAGGAGGIMLDIGTVILFAYALAAILVIEIIAYMVIFT